MDEYLGLMIAISGIGSLCKSHGSYTDFGLGCDRCRAEERFVEFMEMIEYV